MLAWKSYIWKWLAQKLWINFEDLDDFLVKHLWVADITEFISTKIEEYSKWNSPKESNTKAWNDFHWVENDCLKILLARNENMLLAGGWRTVMYEPNRELIKNTKWLVRCYLKVGLEEQIRRAMSQTPEQLINRPALQWLDESEIVTMFTWMQEDRAGIYQDFSEWRSYDTRWKFDDVIEEMYSDIMTLMQDRLKK